MAEIVQRVQVVLEPGQYALLAQLAREQGRSVADVTREAIELGLEQLAERDALERRARALRRADELAGRIQCRTGKPLDIDVAEDLSRLREERDEQAQQTGHRD